MIGKIRKAVNRFLWRYGFEIARPWESNLLQSILFPLLHDKFFFIQIGANDGRRYDPIHDLVVRYKLSGLAVEPLPDMYEALKITDQQQPQVQVCNLAIHRNEPEVILYRVRAYADVLDWAHGIASLNKDHFKFSGTDPAVIAKERVPAVSLQKLLDMHKIKSFDFLQVDTEGYDAEIIRMLLETNCRPRIIQFEHGLTDGIIGQEELYKLIGELMEAGYLVATLHYDAIAFRPE